MICGKQEREVEHLTSMDTSWEYGPPIIDAITYVHATFVEGAWIKKI